MQALTSKPNSLGREHFGLLRRDLWLLRTHHSKPSYHKVSKWIGNSMAWQLPWNKKWNVWPKSPKVTRPTQKKAAKGKAPEFPDYDAMLGSSSASSGQSADLSMRQAVHSLLEANQLKVPDELKTYFQEGEMESLRSEQSVLNKKKKMAAKVDRLRNAKALKTRQWTSYKEELTKKFKKEQDKHEREQEELSAAIIEAQAALDRFTAGEEESENAPSEDLVTLLADPEKIQMAQDLEHAQRKEKNAMELIQEQSRQMAQMQAQLQAYSSQSAAINLDPPAPTSPSNALSEVREQAKKDRRARMKLVEDTKQKIDGTDRERSPRRDSQESNMETLG